MKKLKLIAVAMLALGTTACTYIEPGHQGLRVNLLGSDKGEIEVLSTGRHWEGMNERIYSFPVFEQNQAYKVSMQVEGVQATANVGVKYHLQADQISKIFTTYRKGIDEINSIVIRQALADAGTRVASTMRADDLISSGKEQALVRMEEIVRKSFEGKGIVIEQLYWTGGIENLPEELTNAVNKKIKAQQDAITRQNDIATELGTKEVQKIKADTLAYDITSKADAEAAAIERVGKALKSNPEMLKLEWIKAWNGVQPSTIISGESEIMYGIK